MTCWAAVPSVLFTVAVAPNFLPTASRFSSRSIMMISEGEKSCAVSSAANPIGPEPTMATVEPGWTFPLSTPHSKPVGRMSLNMTNASSSAPSGIGYRLVSACGIRTNSAWVPSIVLPRIQPPVVQWEYMPLRQYSQRPQALMQEISTLSPGLNVTTPGPTESITPTPSWPRMVPGLQVSTSPLRMCRSVPHIVVFVIRTTASVGLWTTGLARSSSFFWPGPW